MYILLLVFIVGCNHSNSGSTSISNPTAKDYLKYDNTDIFLLDGYIYSNSQDLEWVKELEYRLGEQVGEITKQADKASDFENGTANKLLVGTIIFETDTPVYIVIVGKKEIPYLKMVEG